jgi:hypothetical protein
MTTELQQINVMDSRQSEDKEGVERILLKFTLDIFKKCELH